MIKLRQIILDQYKQNSIYTNLDKQQYIKLFKQHCKNITNQNMIVYRGCQSGGDFKLFNGNLKNRQSLYVHHGYSDSFYNWYMSNSQD